MLAIKSLFRMDQKLGFPKPINLEIDKGNCLALVGKSGSGKSLLLKAIADLDETEGTVMANNINKNDLKGYEWRKMVTYVASDAGWWYETVGEHFKNKTETGGYIQKLGLPDEIMSWQISRLSSGEKQRLALIRAFILNPEILLLDEPTSSLDSSSTKKVEQLFKAFLETNKTIVFSTHNLEQAKRLADIIITIKNGIIDDA